MRAMKLARRNPFLTLGLIGFLLFLIWTLVGTPEAGAVAGVLLIWPWRVLLFPFGWVATAIDPWVGRGPEWVDWVATATMGLLPYLALDAAWRRLAPRRAGLQPSAE
jgi:uncharacterized membrane protein YjdF